MNLHFALSTRALGRATSLLALVLLAVTMSGCFVFVHPGHRVRWAEGDAVVRPT